MKYAKGTTVPESRTRGEIEAILKAHGATAFAYAEDRGTVAIAFRLADRAVRMMLPLPGPESEEFTRTPTGRPRARGAALEEWSRECRRRWRALHLVIKAKLEAVASGISTIEREFLADVVLPSGETVSEWFDSQGIEPGQMPPLLGPARIAQQGTEAEHGGVGREG